MIRNIIWDVDGTLFDTYPPIAGALHAALQEMNCPADLIWIENLAKVTLGHCISTLSAEFQIDETELVGKFHSHYDRVTAMEQPPFLGVKAVCEHISSIGGKNLIVTHRDLSSTNELLVAHGMTNLFTGIITRDDGFPRKPDPAAFIAMVKIQNLNSEETITVGDREIDITAGQHAGLFSCYFGSQNSKADLVFQDFAKLLDYIIAV